LAKLALAAKHEPGLKESSINFSKFNTTVDSIAAEAGITRLFDKLKLATAMAGVKAACNLKTGAITVVQDRAGDQKELTRAYDNGWFSTDDPSHYVLHEYAHKLQHDAIARMAGGADKITPEVVGGLRSQIMGAISAINNSPPPPGQTGVLDRAMAVSMYGMTDPLEFFAEYWTGVTLGYVRNDKQFDMIFSLVGMEPPKKSDSATVRYDASGFPGRKQKKKRK
jgi:hypothetical protein